VCIDGLLEFLVDWLVVCVMCALMVYG